ncbi:MAG: DUF4386 domain-containing protein [Acidobacteriales bacterium]|nr:DUF4386 domain-containing protein [Terriglobales bacterium]
MSTMVMTERRSAEASPRLKARIAGGLYMSGVANLFANFVLGSLVAGGDAAATAHNILAHETLYRLAFTADFITVPCYIAVTALFYHLFQPVNRSLALIAVFLGLAGSTLWAVNDFFFLAPLVVLGGAHSGAALTADQVQGLALVFLHVHAQGSNILGVLFGCHVILIGALIFRSTFLPRLLGVWLALAGVCYLTNSFANFLAPQFAAHLVPYILIPGVVEIVLALWLLVLGVNTERWKEQARAAGGRQ